MLQKEAGGTGGWQNKKKWKEGGGGNDTLQARGHQEKNRHKKKGATESVDSFGWGEGRGVRKGKKRET